MAAILPVVVLLLSVVTSCAASATWISNPGDADWNNPANWTPMTVPNGPNDTATFQSTDQYNVSLSSDIQVNAMVFDPSAYNFTFTVGSSSILTLSGTGITNNSGFSQAINTSNGGGAIAFINSATAGDFTFFGIGQNAILTFHNSASAGGATVINYSGSSTRFHDSSTAGNATFGNSSPGDTSFYDSSTAGNATLKGASFYDTSIAGAAIIGNSTSIGNAAFFNSATAGSASITGGASFTNNSGAMTATLRAINGASIVFSGNATGDMARVSVYDTGKLDISGHAAPGVTIGSLEGVANADLGTNRLIVGTNNLDTTFFGHLQDNVGKGSLDKVGTGTLVLANSNTHGGTIIEQGTIRATRDGAFGNSLQAGTYVTVGANGTLTLDSGATNDYFGNNVSLEIVDGSTVNLNFSGAPDKLRSLIVNGITQPPGIYGGPMSGAPNQLPQFTGAGTIMATTKAVSRKIHGAVGSFEIDLPFARPPGIECRSGGSGRDHQIVVTFLDNVTYRTAIVVSGMGSVASSSGSGTNTVTINLTNVANAQTIQVVLVDVNNGTTSESFLISMSVLLGDVSGNGSVNGSDITLVKHTSQAVGASNFRNDVIPNGALNSSDVSTVKFNSGTALP